MLISHQDNGSLDSLLASYATGSLSRPLYTLVASHLAIKSDNRAFVASMETMLANEMEQVGTASKLGVPEHRDVRLSDIFADKTPSSIHQSEPTGVVPASLAAYLDQPFADLQWKSVMPGLREVVIEAGPGREASMLWIKAGRAMPSHTHPGMEATLVLQGSFSDAHGHYERGDIAIVDSDVDHKPIAGSDGDCICFAVSEGPVRLTGPLARLFNKLKWN